VHDVVAEGEGRWDGDGRWCDGYGGSADQGSGELGSGELGSKLGSLEKRSLLHEARGNGNGGSLDDPLGMSELGKLGLSDGESRRSDGNWGGLQDSRSLEERGRRVDVGRLLDEASGRGEAGSNCDGSRGRDGDRSRGN